MRMSKVFIMYLILSVHFFISKQVTEDYFGEQVQTMVINFWVPMTLIAKHLMACYSNSCNVSFWSHFVLSFLVFHVLLWEIRRKPVTFEIGAVKHLGKKSIKQFMKQSSVLLVHYSSKLTSSWEKGIIYTRK